MSAKFPRGGGGGGSRTFFTNMQNINSKAEMLYVNLMPDCIFRMIVFAACVKNRQFTAAEKDFLYMDCQSKNRPQGYKLF